MVPLHSVQHGQSWCGGNLHGGSASSANAPCFAAGLPDRIHLFEARPPPSAVTLGKLLFFRMGQKFNALYLLMQSVGAPGGSRETSQDHSVRNGEPTATCKMAARGRATDRDRSDARKRARSQTAKEGNCERIGFTRRIHVWGPGDFRNPCEIGGKSVPASNSRLKASSGLLFSRRAGSLRGVFRIEGLRCRVYQETNRNVMHPTRGSFIRSFFLPLSGVRPWPLLRTA